MTKKIIIAIILLTLLAFIFVKFYRKGVPYMQEIVVTDVVPGEVKKFDEENNTFIHKDYGFSLNFPVDMTATNFREGDGEQIMFQGDDNTWFQIYISSWDEGSDISVERIKQDLPDIVIIDPQRVILGPKQKEGIGPSALIFYSQDSGLGETREVWFIYEGNLYQMTTYKRLDAMIGEILSTLSFDKSL